MSKKKQLAKVIQKGMMDLLAQAHTDRQPVRDEIQQIQRVSDELRHRLDDVKPKRKPKQ